MDLNFSYSDNSSPNFAGILTRAYDRYQERKTAKEEADKAASENRETAEKSQEGIANSTPTLQNTPRRITPGRSPSPVKANTGGTSKQFTRIQKPATPAARKINPGNPAAPAVKPANPYSPPFKPAPEQAGRHARPQTPDGEPMGRHASPNPPNSQPSPAGKFQRLGKHAQR
jgi:hypothetical protein